MAGTAATDEVALAVEEARLARAAAAGDGNAFATLYERYEQRAYNLAYRITGSEHDAADATQEAFLNVMRRLPQLEDRELAFGSYLFTATRNACHDLMEKRRRAQPSDSIPESATPLGAGGGTAMPDPGDPEEDPDRKLLLESQQEEIRAANLRLPERQREVLALRELEELSYDEIAAIMEMNRNSVAQLISRARINLRDELRGSALAAVAASAPECERALPLIAMRDDAQLDPASDDGAWLEGHLVDCERCRLGVEAMQEAGASYRAWAPIAAAPWLFRETMARAAELAGADWSEIPRPRPARRRRARRGALLAASLAALLLGGVLAVALAGDDPAPDPAQPAAESSHPAAGGSKQAVRAQPGKKQRSTKSKATPTQTAPAAEDSVATIPSATPSDEPSSGSKNGRGPKPPAKQPSGAAGLNPTKTASTPTAPPQAEPRSEEEPSATTEPPATTTEEQPEEPPREPPTREAPVGVAPPPR